MTTDKHMLGTMAFVGSEAVFFMFLIVAYVYFSGPSTGAASKAALDPKVSSMYTLALIASSVTIWRAGALAAQRRPAVGWIAGSAVLGALFLVGQGREYARLLATDVTVSRDLFGTTFFTLTGFHGLHVLIGCVLLAIVALVAALDGDTPRAIEPVSLYWHFVDAVWIVIFTIVYIRPFI